MNTKILALTALMAVTTGMKAQFVISQLDGQKDSIAAKDMTFQQKGDTWTLGGHELSQIKQLSVAPLATQLQHYQAPTYPDYYRSISGWDQRQQWNLANVHDPSVMRAEDGYYYMYTTDASFGNAHSGHGHFMCRRSKNLVDWEFMGATMPKLPSWIKTKLNEIRTAMGLGESTADFSNDELFGFWAPCVRKVSDGHYRMYYAITCPGTIDGDGTWSERAFIGMMETATPWKVDSWEDKGYVITNASDKQLNYKVKADDWANCYFKWNAIDPSYIITPEGQHWLVYGSWHSGFAAVQLNPDTGKPQQELGNPWGDITAYGKRVNTRGLNNRWQASEAPEVVYHNGYYYLFMAYDELAVAYNTRVARSKHIDGPYLGIDGTDISNKGGDAYPIVTHPYKFAGGYGWVGISHCAVFDDGQGHWYYSSQGRLPANAYGDAYSNAIMQGQVRRIVWTKSGWPVVLPECYGAVPQTPVTTQEMEGCWEMIGLNYTYQKQNASSLARLTATDATSGYVTGGPFDGKTWTYDANEQTLNIGATQLHVSRETDWEASPRKATLVFAGIDGKNTVWGKKPQNVMNVGLADNTTPFFSDFSPYYTVSDNSEIRLSFTNHTDKAENWDNWILAFTNDKGRNENGYTEYFVLRADAYGWGNYYNASTISHNYDWATFKKDMDGAKVDMTISLHGTTARIATVTTTTGGKQYSYTFEAKGLPSGIKRAFLSVEKAHLVINTDSYEKQDLD